MRCEEVTSEPGPGMDNMEDRGGDKNGMDENGRDNKAFVRTDTTLSQVECSQAQGNLIWRIDSNIFRLI